MYERRGMISLGPRKLFVILMAFSLLLLSGLVAAADYEMRGRVVRFGGNVGIPYVKVKVRFKKDGVVRIERETKKDGKYSFRVSDYHERVWITYKHKDPCQFSTAGRDSVPNSANPKDLDTIGLVKTAQACADKNAARKAAWGAVRYVVAGGDTEIAQLFPGAIDPKKCKLAFQAVSEDRHLVMMLKELNLGAWIK